MHFFRKRTALTNTDEHYMREAIREARKAEKNWEVPIGCVIVFNGRIIAKAHNTRNKSKSCLGHAEIAAIKTANKHLKDWRLEDCTLYVTLEPCQMCAGAIVQSRVSRVVIGAMSSKAGCAGSILNMLEMKEFNHRCSVTRGVLESECSAMLTDFFKRLREHKKGLKCNSKPKD